MAKDKLSGIYKITHIKSGRSYIGQSIDITRRKYEHARGIGKGPLSRAVFCYGWDAFSFEVVCLCEKDCLNNLEARWISLIGSMSPLGFNLTSGGGSNSTVSEETKKKISEAGTGRKQSEDTVKKRIDTKRKNGTIGGWKISESAIKKRTEIPCRMMCVYLDEQTIERLRRLGSGNLSAGIRAAADVVGVFDKPANAKVSGSPALSASPRGLPG